jgi:hypothetical protein
MQVGGTAIAGLESIPKGSIPDESPVQRGSVVKRSETDPTPDRFVVTKPAKVLVGGFRTELPEGKIIDTSNYDIAMLKRLGVRLQPYTED